MLKVFGIHVRLKCWKWFLMKSSSMLSTFVIVQSQFFVSYERMAPCCFHIRICNLHMHTYIGNCKAIVANRPHCTYPQEVCAQRIQDHKTNIQVNTKHDYLFSLRFHSMFSSIFRLHLICSIIIEWIARS